MKGPFSENLPGGTPIRKLSEGLPGGPQAKHMLKTNPSTNVPHYWVLWTLRVYTIIVLVCKWGSLWETPIQTASQSRDPTETIRIQGAPM